MVAMSRPASSPVLETARLRLRRLSEADAPFMLELLNDPDFIRNIADRGPMCRFPISRVTSDHTVLIQDMNIAFLSPVTFHF